MNILVEIQQLLRDCNAIVHALARIILDSSENCVLSYNVCIFKAYLINVSLSFQNSKKKKMFKGVAFSNTTLLVR